MARSTKSSNGELAAKAEANSVPLGPAFEQFSWPFDAHDLREPARRVFEALEARERRLAVKWAPEFLRLCKAQGRKSHMSAASWLRRKGWQAFHSKPEQGVVACVFVRLGSPQWFAWEEYHRAARDVRFFKGKLIALDLAAGRGRMEKSEWPPTRPPLPLGDAGREAPS